MKDPNNIRNRWRRKRAAFIAYGWGTGPYSSFPSVRAFAKHYPRDAYSAGPREAAEPFAELLKRARGVA